ncbi:MAG: hypothetical protein JNK45_36205, partial [Myxococcales bacterium]|nr:hypothetical protein [Myxococcales bacterium]
MRTFVRSTSRLFALAGTFTLTAAFASGCDNTSTGDGKVVAGGVEVSKDGVKAPGVEINKDGVKAPGVEVSKDGVKAGEVGVDINEDGSVKVEGGNAVVTADGDKQ